MTTPAMAPPERLLWVDPTRRPPVDAGFDDCAGDDTGDPVEGGVDDDDRGDDGEDDDEGAEFRQDVSLPVATVNGFEKKVWPSVVPAIMYVPCGTLTAVQSKLPLCPASD